MAERKKISARDVAGLDPFGVRRDAVGELEAVLRNADTRSENAPAFSGDFEGSLVAREKEAWKKVLGVEVDVKPVPEYVDEQIVEKLKGFGLELRYIPKVKLEGKNSLDSLGVDAYLGELERRYPNWRRYAALTEDEKKDQSIFINLEGNYWRFVREGHINFPMVSSCWIAVETFPMAERSLRFYSSEMVDRQVDEANKKLLESTGLKSVRMRLLTPIEWNLLENRGTWGRAASFEWTRTSRHSEFKAVAVGVGGKVRVVEPVRSGFRLAAYLYKQKRGKQE